MMRSTVFLRFMFGATVSAALYCATPAQASIQAKLNSVDRGSDYAVTLYGSSGSTTNSTYNAGVFHWKNQNPTEPDFVNGVNGSGVHVFDPPVGEFISFCIELTQTVSLGTTYDMTIIDLAEAPKPGSAGPAGLHSSPMGPDAAGYLSILWANYLDEALTLGADYRAAFQLAIWELAYDQADLTFTDPDLASLGAGLLNGRFQAAGGPSSLVYTKARDWLDSLPTLTGSSTLAGITRGKYNNFQDQIVETIPPGRQMVPEPASLIVWGLLAAVIGLATANRYGS